MKGLAQPRLKARKRASEALAEQSNPETLVLQTEGVGPRLWHQDPLSCQGCGSV